MSTNQKWTKFMDADVENPTWTKFVDDGGDRKHLHQAQVSSSVMDDVRAYKEYERSNGNSMTMNDITELALISFIKSHKDDMLTYHDTRKQMLERL